VPPREPDNLTEDVVFVRREVRISTVGCGTAQQDRRKVQLCGDLRAHILSGAKRLWYDNDITFTHAQRNEHGRIRIDS
jgi:hypothetical protein